MLSTLLLLATWLTTPASAACPEPTSVDQLAADVQQSLSAFFVTGDLDGFQAAARRTSTTLGCLGEPIGADAAAGVHLIEALAAFAEQDTPRLEGAACALLALDPEYEIPTALAGAQHPLQQRIEATACEVQVLVPLGAGRTARVDGFRAGTVPGDPAWRPYVLQLLDDDAPTLTVLVPLGGSPPAGTEPAAPDPVEGPASAPPIDEPAPRVTTVNRRKRTAVGLIVGGSVVGVLGIGTGIATAAAAGFDPDAASPGLVAANVAGYAVGGAGFGATAIGVVLALTSPQDGPVTLHLHPTGVLAVGRF